jgi:hypothetical protein
LLKPLKYFSVAILLLFASTKVVSAIGLSSRYSADSNKRKLIANQTFYQRCIAWPDTLRKDRYYAVAGGATVLWGGSMYFLNQIWYANYPKAPFHLYNDNGEWLQMDKVGHVYSTYLGTRLFTTFFRWSGVNKNKSRTLGIVGGMAYQSIIEILDGYSYKWGFSPGDMGANFTGSMLYALQDKYWGEQRIFVKYSTHRKDYKTVELLNRANQLFGESTAERIWKDYNAQTYWLSVSPSTFKKNSRWPAWLSIAVGYGAEGMYGGYENIARDDFGNIIYNPNGKPAFDRQDIPRYRQYYLAPDIDFSRIPWRSKFMKDFFKIVNLKMPLPSLELNSLGNFRVNTVHW